MKVDAISSAVASALGANAGVAPAEAGVSSVGTAAAQGANAAQSVKEPNASSAAAPGKATDSTQGIKNMAAEFERILLIQMLRTSRAFGDEKGHGAMLVDAMADGVMRGGGLGLSSTIVRAFERSMAASQGAPSKPEEKSSAPSSSPTPVVRSSG
jgi:Rod binding domain-containing protein